MDMVNELVERADKTFSKQPRFSENYNSVFSSIYLWINKKELDPPEYKTDSRSRDKWLRRFYTLEPHWMGVVNQCVQIDSNRGWVLIGGRNQVKRYMNILQGAEGGWRTFVKKASLSFLTSDMCAVVELGRDGKGGPLRGLYNVDPVRCKLSGPSSLQYYPSSGKFQTWEEYQDYFRIVAMPSADESFNNLGYSATSKAIEIVKILYGVLMHDQEQVGARMPEGLLLLQGISERQWVQALEARKENLDALDRRWFGGIMALASSGADQISANLVSLSQLPANFDRKTFIDMCLYAYALIVGYAPGEFWPVQYGAMGRGKEEEQQGMRATSKGGTEFILGLQENVQNEMPNTLHFEFEQRNEDGLLLQAQVSQAWADVVKTLYARPSECDEPVLTRDECRSLLVKNQVIPSDWTEVEEETQITDTDDSSAEASEAVEEEVRKFKNDLLDIPSVYRAAQANWSEPIVRYEWPSGRTTVLWNRGFEAISRKSFPVSLISRKIRDRLDNGEISVESALDWVDFVFDEIE